VTSMFTYTSRRGYTYYVHEVRTKTGSRRYIANRIVDGALTNLPAGMEIVENVNGQVSVRAIRSLAILPLEEQKVLQALTNHGQEKYRVEVKGRDITVYEPNSNADALAELLNPPRPKDALGTAVDKMMRKKVGDAAWEQHLRQKKEQARQNLERTMRYSPVLRFRLDDSVQRLFSVERMCYRGEGGWLWLSGDMPLVSACERYVPLLGTEELFDEC
jgi:hypothetical protein